jgi:Fic family protein
MDGSARGVREGRLSAAGQQPLSWIGPPRTARRDRARETEKLFRQVDLNHRQIALLSHALRHPDAEYTFRSHQTSHGVVYQSARTDLLDLEQRGLLERRTVGQRFVFRPVKDLAERVAAPS